MRAENRPGSRAANGAWAASLAVLAMLLAATVSHWLTVLSFPYQIDFGEGPILDLARTVARGELPYKAIDARPWNFSVYTPLYIIASGLLVDLFPANPWLGGRLLNVMSSLLLGGLLVYYVRARGVRHPLLLLAMGALWFASPFVAIWSVLFRVDLFAMLWSIVGFLLLDRAVRDEDPRLLVVAAAAMVLGFFSKQSLFAAPVAATLFLLSNRPRWLAWLVIPGVLGGVAGGLALRLVAGKALVANLNVPAAHAYSFDRLLSFQVLFWLLMAPAALVALRALPNRLGERQRLLSLYLLVSLPVTIAVAKRGSELNYFLESLWLLLALVGVELARRDERRPSLAPGVVLVQSLLFALAFAVLVAPTSAPGYLALRRGADEVIAAALNELPADALVYSENMGLIAQSGRVLEIDPLLYSQLALEGYWDESPLVRSLAAGEAALLIQSRDAPVNPGRRFVWTTAMHDAAETGYEIGLPAGEWSVRHPRPIAPGATHDIGTGFALRGWLLVDGVNAGISTSAGGDEPVQLHLLLETHEEQVEPVWVEVELLDRGGVAFARAQGPLRGGFHARWPAGTLLRHEQGLTVPSIARAESLSLKIVLVQGGRSVGSALVELTDERVIRR